VIVLGASLTACQASGSENVQSSGGGISTASEAIRAVQAQYKEVSQIKPNLTPQPFVPDRVAVNDYEDRWDLVFVTGSGDCPSGCLNNYYWYFSVWKDGKIEKIGEFSREFISSSNSYEEKGTPLWGVPR
jgi:hypothetical protein